MSYAVALNDARSMREGDAITDEFQKKLSNLKVRLL